jgi:prolycopene isomerase
MRYLGHPGGAIYGFEQDVMDTDVLHQPQVDPPIANLHLAGSWVVTGGFQPTLQAGADLARHLISDLSKETQR